MDIVLKTFSQFSQDYVIFPIIIFGIVFLDRRLFLRIAVLLLFGIAINVFLKNVFQVPLNPFLHKDWWAFPSGHAQLTATFYGYLAYAYRNNFLTLIAGAIIGGVCLSLIYFQYHDWIDVVGGLLTAVAWVILFEWLRKIPLFRDRFYLLALIFVPLAFILEHYSSKVPAVHQIVLGSLVGLAFGLLVDRFIPSGKFPKFVEILVIFGGALGLYFGMSYFLATPLSKTIGIPGNIGILLLYGLPVFWVVCGSGVAGCIPFIRKR